MEVGRSAWELKIDPKRLRKKKKTTSNKEERKDKNRGASIMTKRTTKDLQNVLTPPQPRKAKKKGEQFGRRMPPRSAPLRAVILMLINKQ